MTSRQNTQMKKIFRRSTISYCRMHTIEHHDTSLFTVIIMINIRLFIFYINIYAKSYTWAVRYVSGFTPFFRTKFYLYICSTLFNSIHLVKELHIFLYIRKLRAYLRHNKASQNSQGNTTFRRQLKSCKRPDLSNNPKHFAHKFE